MKPEKLSELLERASIGDREAYSPILNGEFLPKSRAKYFPDPAINEDDLYQETLLKLFLKCEREEAKWVDKEGKPVKNKLGYFRGMHNCTYWELRRAGNKSKQNRKQQVEEDLSSPFWPEPLPRSEEIAAPNSDPSAFVEADELEALIWEKYNPSNPKWKQAAWLCYKRRWKLADIAEMMNIKLGTLKSLLSREKGRLAKFLNAHGYNLPSRF